MVAKSRGSDKVDLWMYLLEHASEGASEALEDFTKGSMLARRLVERRKTSPLEHASKDVSGVKIHNRSMLVINSGALKMSLLEHASERASGAQKMSLLECASKRASGMLEDLTRWLYPHT